MAFESFHDRIWLATPTMQRAVKGSHHTHYLNKSISAQIQREIFA